MGLWSGRRRIPCPNGAVQVSAGLPLAGWAMTNGPRGEELSNITTGGSCHIGGQRIRLCALRRWDRLNAWQRGGRRGPASCYGLLQAMHFLPGRHSHTTRVCQACPRRNLVRWRTKLFVANASSTVSASGCLFVWWARVGSQAASRRTPSPSLGVVAGGLRSEARGPLPEAHKVVERWIPAEFRLSGGLPSLLHSCQGGALGRGHLQAQGASAGFGVFGACSAFCAGAVR